MSRENHQPPARTPPPVCCNNHKVNCGCWLGRGYCAECPNKPAVSGKHSKYHREIKPGVFVDVYDVLQAWAVSNPALQHLIKKALQPGERGHKDLETDMNDIIASAKRAKELEQ